MLTKTNHYRYTLFNSPLPKLYTASLLANLNVRSSWANSSFSRAESDVSSAEPANSTQTSMSKKIRLRRGGTSGAARGEKGEFETGPGSGADAERAISSVGLSTHIPWCSQGIASIVSTHTRDAEGSVDDSSAGTTAADTDASAELTRPSDAHANMEERARSVVRM